VVVNMLEYGLWLIFNEWGLRVITLGAIEVREVCNTYIAMKCN
jgi:hypothetical protein